VSMSSLECLSHPIVSLRPALRPPGFPNVYFQALLLVCIDRRVELADSSRSMAGLTVLALLDQLGFDFVDALIDCVLLSRLLFRGLIFLADPCVRRSERSTGHTRKFVQSLFPCGCGELVVLGALVSLRIKGSRLGSLHVKEGIRSFRDRARYRLKGAYIVVTVLTMMDRPAVDKEGDETT